MDAAERALLAETIGGALTAAGTGAGTDVDADADAILADLGWLEMLDAERTDAIGIVFEALGSTNAAATVLDDVVGSAFGSAPRSDLAVLLPPFAGWDPPGRIDGGKASALGLATARVATADELLVACNTGADVCVVMLPTASVDVRAVQGIDPALGLHTVRIEIETPPEREAVDWNGAVDAGRLAVAHQIAGASRAMLGLARAHAVDRVQFGRRIASFQAVRHRLAEALVAVESLEATLGAAADEPNALTAALAKATAGRTARTVSGHCQQVLAGIGFTTDHPFHRFLKRTMALEGLFGSSDDIAVDIGRQFLEARRVPTLVEL